MMRWIPVLSIVLVGSAAMLLQGCHRSEASETEGGGHAGILDVRWMLIGLNDKPVEIGNEAQRPHFTLHSEQNRMDGFTGCNQMFGEFEIEEGRLSFGPIGATRMACMETGDLEQDFLKAMEATRSFYLDVAELELYDAHGHCVALFSASPSELDEEGERE